MTQLRICLLGHSGVGKTTTAGLIHTALAARQISCAMVKVAAPLYELQHAFYARLGEPLSPGQQDQQLLEATAAWIRTRRPMFLVEDFLARASAVRADALVNDDVRSYDVDYPALRRRGWTAVRVCAHEDLRAKRLAAQGYVSRSDASTAGVEAIDVDREIRNDGTFDELAATVTMLIEGMLRC